MMGFEQCFQRWFTAVLGVAQIALTSAIIRLEVRSVYIDLVHGAVWAGFRCSIVFLKTYLMTFLITYCCRGRCCATYLLTLNVARAALAGVLVYFNQYFMKSLGKYYLGDQLCCAIRGINSFNANYDMIAQNCTISLRQAASSTLTCPTYPSNKLVYLQGQLGCVLGMLGVYCLHVVLYLFACTDSCFGH